MEQEGHYHIYTNNFSNYYNWNSGSSNYVIKQSSFSNRGINNIINFFYNSNKIRWESFIVPIIQKSINQISISKEIITLDSEITLLNFRKDYNLFYSLKMKFFITNRINIQTIYFNSKDNSTEALRCYTKVRILKIIRML